MDILTSPKGYIPFAIFTSPKGDADKKQFFYFGFG